MRSASTLTNVILLTIVLVVGVFTTQALAQGDTWDTTKASKGTATFGSSAGVIDGILNMWSGVEIYPLWMFLSTWWRLTTQGLAPGLKKSPFQMPEPLLQQA